MHKKRDSAGVINVAVVPAMAILPFAADYGAFALMHYIRVESLRNDSNSSI
jgi:hypothetical protein